MHLRAFQSPPLCEIADLGSRTGVMHPQLRIGNEECMIFVNFKVVDRVSAKSQLDPCNTRGSIQSPKPLTCFQIPRCNPGVPVQGPERMIGCRADRFVQPDNKKISKSAVSQDSYYICRRFFPALVFLRGRPIGAALRRRPTRVSILLINRSDPKAWRGGNLRASPPCLVSPYPLVYQQDMDRPTLTSHRRPISFNGEMPSFGIVDAPRGDRSMERAA